jgi:hypothetical protein
LREEDEEETCAEGEEVEEGLWGVLDAMGMREGSAERGEGVSYGWAREAEGEGARHGGWWRPDRMEMGEEVDM